MSITTDPNLWAICALVFLLGLLIGEEGELGIDFEDDIVDAACIAHEGKLRGERTAGAKPAEGEAG